MAGERPSPPWGLGLTGAWHPTHTRGPTLTAHRRSPARRVQHSWVPPEELSPSLKSLAPPTQGAPAAARLGRLLPQADTCPSHAQTASLV